MCHLYTLSELQDQSTHSVYLTTPFPTYSLLCPKILQRIFLFSLIYPFNEFYVTFSEHVPRANIVVVHASTYTCTMIVPFTL